MQFKNCPEQNQMQQYFNQLPSYIQENIEQSGIKIQSMEQLKNCAENLTKFQSSFSGAVSTSFAFRFKILLRRYF